MAFRHIDYRAENRVCIITLNRPDKYNAMTDLMREELLAAIRQSDEDAEIRAVVITGAGRGFCSGGDMKEKLAAVERGEQPDASSKISPIRNQIVLALRGSRKPFIAAVNGIASGGGMNIALACDIRVASTNAKFSQSFTKRGMHPDWGSTYFLPRLIGTAKACELIWSGRTIDANEAMDLGLVSELTDPEELIPTATSLASQFAAGPPIAIGLAKQAIYRNVDADLADALDFESYAQLICAETDDIKEGINAFLEKRAPDFQGR